MDIDSLLQNIKNVPMEKAIIILKKILIDPDLGAEVKIYDKKTMKPIKIDSDNVDYIAEMMYNFIISADNETIKQMMQVSELKKEYPEIYDKLMAEGDSKGLEDEEMESVISDLIDGLHKVLDKLVDICDELKPIPGALLEAVFIVMAEYFKNTLLTDSTVKEIISYIDSTEEKIDKIFEEDEELANLPTELKILSLINTALIMMHKEGIEEPINLVKTDIIPEQKSKKKNVSNTKVRNHAKKKNPGVSSGGKVVNIKDFLEDDD